MSNALQILGGLGVFLFGMRVMSQGLQKFAGNRLRAVLHGMTQNRVSGIFSGFLITATVQSSSATTVLVVSFANAGLINVFQSIGIIMGANIGTTVTAWLVALLGFKVKISAFALPIIGIAFPLSLINSTRAKQLSEIFVGFGLLFLGLAFLKAGVPNIKSNPESLEFLKSLSGYGFGSVILFAIAGTVLTIVVQSSSAASTITLAMAAEGWIDYKLAAAMVLGENIGTTITALLAAIGTTNNAKRAARAHTLFNLIGVLWMLPLLGVYIHFIDLLVPGDPWAQGVSMDQSAVPAHLAAFHTAFNITNTLLLVGFVSTIERIVKWWVPVTDAEHEGAHLEFLETGLLGTPELAGVEARRGLQQMTGVCTDMFESLERVVTHPDEKLGPVVDEIKVGEVKTDEMEEEIVHFCTELARAGSSEKVGRSVAAFLEMANDIERIGDHCYNLVKLAERRYEKGYHFPEEAQKELEEMLGLVRDFLGITHHALAPDAHGEPPEAKVIESKIDRLRDHARKAHAERMQAGEVGVREGLVYIDMITNLEKVGDYCENVVRAISDLPNGN
jgi:phosphate:Na+ symporter